METLILGMLIIAFVWLAMELRTEKQKRRFLTQRINTMAATVATVSASLTQAQNTLAAIVAANPTSPDLSGLQAQADDLATGTANLANTLGVTVPAAPATADTTTTPPAQ
jgi:hypothetical protein